MSDKRNCSCGAPPTRTAIVSDTPGSIDGRPVRIHLCERCYIEEGWAESDLRPQGDMWSLATGRDFVGDEDDGDLMEANY